MKQKEIAPLVSLSIAAALLAAFAAIAVELAQGNLGGLDRALLLTLREPGHPASPLGPPWLEIVADDVTGLGSTALITLLTVAALGFLALKRLWGDALLVLFSIGGGTALNFALKELVHRDRPRFRSRRGRGDFHPQLSERPRFPVGGRLSHARPVAGAHSGEGGAQGLYAWRSHRAHDPGRHEPPLSQRALADGCACGMVRRRWMGHALPVGRRLAAVAFERGALIPPPGAMLIPMTI